MGVVVIHLYLQFLLGNGQVEGGREARVPSLLLLKPFVCKEGLSAGQKRDVLSQDMGRAIAFARRSAQREMFPGRIFNMESRCPESATHGGVIPADAWHDGEFVVQFESVLRVQPSGRLVGRAKEVGLLSQQTIVQDERLVVRIVIERSADAEIVLRREVCLKHELGIAVLLLHIVARLAKGVRSIVYCPIQHEGERGVVLRIERQTILPLRLITVRLHPNAVVGDGFVVRMVPTHAACALIAERLDIELAYPAGRDVGHAPHSIVLAQLGHVHETIVVAVVVRLSVFEVQQNARRKPIVQMDAAVNVDLLFQFIVQISVGAQAVRALRLEVLHVDLSRDTLVAVLHARGPLAHLNALNPRARHVAQRVGQAGTSKVGHILGEHLHVRAAQPKEFDLAGSRCCVTIGNVHRRIGRERFAQIATSRADEFARANDFCICHKPSRAVALARLNRDVSERVVIEYGIFRGNSAGRVRLSTYVDRCGYC